MPDNAATKAFDWAFKDTINMARVEAGSVASVKSFLNTLEADLVGILNGNKEISAGKREKLEKILSAGSLAIDSNYHKIKKNAAADLFGVAAIQAKGAAKMVNLGVGVDVMGAVLTENQLKAVASNTLVFGHRSGAWWDAQADSLRFKFAAQMKQGYALGEDVDALVRRVRGTKAGNFADGIMQTSRREAEALVRSSIQTIANTATLESFSKMGETVKGIEWLATLDSRTTLKCRALDGKVWRLPDFKPVGHDKVFPGSTAHWNCVREGQEADPHGQPILRGYSRDYVGQFVTIKTARGHELTVTPNHPILTSQGFVPAGELSEGGDVISDFVPRESAIFGTGEFHTQQGPALIEEITGALQESIGFVTVSVIIRGIDFHGDGEKGQVAVVSTDRRLLNEINPSVEKHPMNQGFLLANEFSQTGADIGLGAKSFLAINGPTVAGSEPLGLCGIGGVFPPVLHRLGFIPDGMASLANPIIEGMSLAPYIGDDVQPAVTCDVPIDSGFTDFLRIPIPSARLDAGLMDALPDPSLSQSELAHQILNGSLGEVQIDKIISVDFWEGEGRVHNLETSKNFYSAQGIITGNCRSRQIPVLRSWAELAGKKIEALDGATFEEKLAEKLAAKGMAPDKIALAKANARASMDGQASGSPDMQKWFEGRTDKQVRDMIGPQRAKLFSDGKIQVSDLTDQDNRPLTVAQLMQAIDDGTIPPETEGLDFIPYDATAAAKFEAPKKAVEVQTAAQSKIDDVLANPKAIGNSILGANIAKIQAADPLLSPAEVLAKAEEVTSAKIAANTKSSILSKAKKKMLAGELPTSAQQAIIDDLGDEENAAFLEAVADAKTAKEAVALKKQASDALTQWHENPVKQQAIVAALKTGIASDDPVALLNEAHNQLSGLVASSAVGNTTAAAKKAMKALTGMDSPTDKSVAAWMSKEGKDPAEFLAEFNAVAKEKLDASVKSSVLSKAKKKVAAGEDLTPAQMKVWQDLTPEEKHSFDEDVEAMKGKNSAAVANATKAANDAAQLAASAAAAKTATESKAFASQASTAARAAQATVPHPDELKIVSTLGGSTGAKLAEDKDGNRFVVKRGAEPDHVRSEMLADDLYRALGLNVPEGALFETTGGPVKVTRFVDGGKPLSSFTGKEREKHFATLREDFAVDALMANWDVAGTGLDNVLVTPDGRVWRIDNGGSLKYRAQGDTNNKNWNRYPDELWSMRDPSNISGPIFGKLDVFEIADQIDGHDWDRLKNVPIDQATRDILDGRLEEMKRVASRAKDFRNDGYNASHTDGVTRATIDIRQAGIVSSMPSKLVQKPGSGGEWEMVDPNGRQYGSLRTLKDFQTNTPVVQKVAGDIYSDDILIATKALASCANVSKDVSAGTAPGKMAKLMAIKPDLQALAKGKGETADMAKSYLTQIEALETLYKAGGIPAGPPPNFSAMTPTAVAAKAPTLQNTTSIVKQWESLMAAEGIPTTAVSQWLKTQSGNSWTPETQAMKIAFARGFIDPKGFYWEGNNIKTTFATAETHYRAAVKQTGGEEKMQRLVTSWHAVTQEILSNVAAPWIDTDRRAVLLLRTVRKEEMDGSIQQPDKQGVFIPLRGTTESHSIYKPTSIFGSIVTAQAVPFSRVLSTYWTEKPGATSGGGFAGDHEAEFAANTSGIKALKTPTSWKKPGFDDASKNASTWGVPLGHLTP